MNNIEKKLLEKIVDLHSTPSGAFSIRKNGVLQDKSSTKEIEIIPKKNKSGIDIKIKSGTQNKSVHIPVIITIGGLNDIVYNDFYIGENCNVVIVAGCGIHNDTCNSSSHNGIHRFYVGENSHIKYIEKHVAEGKGSGEKILNPVTKVYLKENSSMEIETLQIEGVTSSVRKTQAILNNNSILKIRENVLTDKNQTCKTIFDVKLNGYKSSVDVISHSVAKNKSYQEFKSILFGNNECFGHVECDGIVLDNAQIISTPMVCAKNSNASLVHEAAIGKIAGEELVKLMSLGLNKEEAENIIIEGFLLG